MANHPDTIDMNDNLVTIDINGNPVTIDMTNKVLQLNIGI